MGQIINKNIKETIFHKRKAFIPINLVNKKKNTKDKSAQRLIEVAAIQKVDDVTDPVSPPLPAPQRLFFLA